MLVELDWATWLTWLLVAFFLADGVISAIGPAPMRAAFVKWGYPGWWHLVNAAVCLVIALLLVFPQTRQFGLMFGVLECVAVFATLIRHGELTHLPPAIVLLALLVLAYWGNYGWTLPGAAVA